MLLEIRCDKFMSCGERRPPIAFHTGLNTVLGSETGSNSIGKSTLLMILDFVFGGDDYVLKSTDVQAQVGPHSIQFAFEFNGNKHFFSRETINHTRVILCDTEYNPISETSREEFRTFLSEQYGIKLPLITFRDIVGRYFRIYGRENLDEKRPLHTAKGEPPKKAIKALMMLLNKYAAVHDLEQAVDESKNEKDAYKKAQDFHFIPKIGKRQFAANEKRIEELQAELAQLHESSGNELMGLDSQQVEYISELRRKLTSVKRQKSRLNSQLTVIESDMSADSIDTPRRQSNFQALLRFFPDANLKKIEDIEQFHHQLVGVLIAEYEEARRRYLSLIELATNEVNVLENEIKASGLTPKVSRTLLEEYAFKSGQIKAFEKENVTYSKMEELKIATKNMEERLIALQEEQIGFLQSAINVQMDEINDTVYQGVFGKIEVRRMAVKNA